MTLTFLSHQWKSFWRSKNTGKSIAIHIGMGIIILYFLFCLLFLSFIADTILTKTIPGQPVLTSFSGLMLYYFFIDLVLRYQFQELPTIAIKPYLNLPVHRKQIINYLSAISLLSGFIAAPFILTIPFLLKTVLPQYGFGTVVSFLIPVAGLTVFNHFFCLWLKRREQVNGWFTVLFLMAVVTIFFLDFRFHVISLSTYSTWIFKVFITQPAYCLIPILAGLTMYIINYNFLNKNLYLEEISPNSQSTKSSTDFPVLNRFGKVGDLAANELKLIIRNKRPRSSVTMTAIFLFYGLIFYRRPDVGEGMYVFIGMFMTGMFIINYGQFMFSWQSAHFDNILINKISIKDFFKAKFLLITVFATTAFLLTVPYVYFGWKVLLIHFIMYIWNLGFNALLVLFFATKNFKRLDLSKSATFNWQGIGATQWILSIPLMLAPYLIFLPFKWLGYTNVGLAAIGVAGLVLILTREFWLNQLVKEFNKNRYKIAEGFRNG